MVMRHASTASKLRYPASNNCSFWAKECAPSLDGGVPMSNAAFVVSHPDSPSERPFVLTTAQLTALDVGELLVMTLRYGFDGLAPRSRGQIADLLGYSRETVRRAEKSGLSKLWR
jgi:hypothetical protein